MIKKIKGKLAKKLLTQIIFDKIHKKLLIVGLGFIATVCSLGVPYYQKEFLNGFQVNNLNDLTLFLIMIFFLSAFSHLFLFLGKIIGYFESNRILRNLSLDLYAKIFCIKEKDQQSQPSGETLALYTTDIQTAVVLIDDVLPNMTSYLIPILLTPFALMLIIPFNPLSIYLLLAFLLGVNCLMGVKQSHFFYRNKIFSSLRIGQVNEWLMNMRTIRMLNWIDFMERKIKHFRKLETQNRLAMVTNGSSMNSIGYTAPFLLNTIAIYLLIRLEGIHITAGEIFSVLWIFGVLLTRPLRMIPMTLVTINDCITSINRVEKFFQKDSDPTFVEHKNSFVSNEGKCIEIKNLSSFSNKKCVIDSVDLSINKKEFIAIIGEVGSGKTALLKSILGISATKFDEYCIDKKSISSMGFDEAKSYFSYVPQDLFIMSSSIRDNVAFEYNCSKNEDKKILQSLNLAQFELNTESNSFTLDTEIGERGVNLSGGQKQRLALARAHYFNKPIVLLDDCLSALDPHTEEKIIKHLINDAWKEKTIILVTHRLSVLPKCDKVLFMKNGKIIENGSFEELYKKSDNVRNFITIAGS